MCGDFFLIVPFHLFEYEMSRGLQVLGERKFQDHDPKIRLCLTHSEDFSFLLYLKTSVGKRLASKIAQHKTTQVRIAERLGVQRIILTQEAVVEEI